MGTRTIIIIEDSEIIADLINKFIVDKFGFRVKWFDSGEAYFNQSERGDLIFLDFYLDSRNRSAMNGIDFLKQLNRQNLQIPVILISGITDKQIIKELRQLKIASFIDKDTPEFWAQVENELRKNIGTELSTTI